MKKHLKQFRDSLPSEYYFSYHFINQCKALGPVKQKVVNYMMSDFDMNGIVRWTREKYAKDTGASYGATCKCFDLLIAAGILTPLEGSSNYHFNLSKLQRACKLNEWPSKKPTPSISDANIGESKTDIGESKTNIEYSKTNTEYQHTDTKDLTYSKDLLKEDNPSSSPHGEDESPSTPEITLEEMNALLSEIKHDDEREKLFGT